MVIRTMAVQGGESDEGLVHNVNFIRTEQILWPSEDAVIAKYYLFLAILHCNRPHLYYDIRFPFKPQIWRDPRGI